jgi:uncharacterized protein YndB with AHSA1/START domain
MSVTHATFKIERRYPCTPHEAFRAFAAPELKRQWFVIPGNWPNAKWKLDFRVGGSEFHSGGAPGGRHNAFQARYHDIVEGERIVFAYDLLHDSRLVSVSLTTIEFFDDADGTRLLFTEQGAYFDDPDGSTVREHGTGKMLDALRRVLA